MSNFCNIPTYISSVNTWDSGDSGDSSLAQLVKELDLCLFLYGTQRPWD